MNTSLSKNNSLSSSSGIRESFYSYCLNSGKQFLLEQWDYSKNIEISPEIITAKSHKWAWWTCEKGHSWQAQVNSRVDGAGCPVCSNKKDNCGC